MTRRTILTAGTGLLASTLPGLAAEHDAYDALALAQLIARKQFTALELLHAVRRKAELLQPKLNAFCHLFFDRAEAQIRAGLPAGPFHGVPFALKDLGQYLDGTITSAGSRVWKNAVADHDSTYVSRLKRTGFVLFAKTSTPELGLAYTTESVVYGQTHNPWNLDRTSGGSSGGSAAAVARRVSPVPHASDGGGSLPIPASCCGLFRLKPTPGPPPPGPSQFDGWN